ncbi:MAG: hypothetical protein DME96_09865 [Verrucomicrobia bacterium]|nr:MAG: hypothetical protein DME96_09865 [Verrucomicrobiota bacterium]
MELANLPCWVKRILFLVVTHIIAFAEGYYLIPFGLDWLLPTAGKSIFLAVLWFREYWSCS